MKALIAGASGFLGSALADHLEQGGHEVTRLVRRPARTGESRWDPYEGRVDLDLVEAADVVVNLAGAPIAHFPWTSRYTRVVTESRVRTTATLAEAVAGSHRKPTFLAQNGVAGYGDQADRVVTEDDPADSDAVLGQVTSAWADATLPAQEAGARVVLMRTGVVLDRRGGALRPMLPAFRLGLGARIGDGQQYFSTISLDDWLRAVVFLAQRDEAAGAFNLTGPQPVTNEEFTRALAAHLHRKAFLRVPAAPLRKLAGPLSSELLSSLRLHPKRLLDAGFEFRHPTIDDQLDAALRQTS